MNIDGEISVRFFIVPRIHHGVSRVYIQGGCPITSSPIFPSYLTLLRS